MTINRIIRKSIEHQFSSNSRKNFFHSGKSFKSHFLPDTRNAVEANRNELLKMEGAQSGQWIDLMTERALRTFCQSNQFIDLRKDHLAGLHSVYELLWNDLVAQLHENTIDFERLEQAHLSRLTNWILVSNPFVKELNSPDLPEIVEVVCAEYSARLQIALLRINPDDILEPLLDIGCGEQANLVKHMRQLGIDAWGNDRLADSSQPFLLRANWLEFDYQPKQWGTIIANHSFSLHFLNQNQRSDGDYLGYARKYMEILYALKPGGSFHYAPSLPFIESFLPAEFFQVRELPINKTVSGTKVTRLRKD